MIRAQMVACALVACASLSAAHAGPCSADIDTMQARIDAALQARAAAGGTARESAGAKMRRQPTPSSIAEAEVKLGEVPAQTVDSIKNAMTRARAADGAGDERGCKEALAIIQRALDH